ncbi:YkgJ family cysteine cluster protein [Phenylobacterium sp.]|uniref:YkgJ family cysteine cluster protein n=1 Tax=Phenylobacterium sp. TaxID=1871053 RepID=UPI0035AE868D|nr:YkgJ family cysteine cluster protein [Pseudomonadota bacterium]
MGKSCGECGMCCKLLAIQSLDKPAGAWCGHFKRAAGCGVYEERPPACRGFVCLWLDSEKLDEAWRPDRAKFLMYTEKDGQRLNVIVDPNHPGAWKREPYYRRLKAMSELALGGRELVVCVGDRRIVVFPHEDVDLGLVDPEHKLVSGYAERDGMMVPYAMILSDVASD